MRKWIAQKIIKSVSRDYPELREAKKKFKNLLDKKKGKDLDWDDVKKSYKIFTKK